MLTAPLSRIGMKTFTFRLFTNASQERELSRTLETHRRLYNDLLDRMQLCRETAGVNWTLYDQTKWFTVQRTINHFYGSLNVTSARQTMRRLDRAFKSFYARCKRGEKPGYPRFKGRDQFDSFEFVNGYSIVDGKLRLQHIGTIRVSWHRELEGKIKVVRIVRDGDKWFVQFICEASKPERTELTEAVGLDVGLNAFVMTSDGEAIGDSKTMSRRQKELRVKQRALARSKKGSNRRKKVKKRVTKLHSKVRNTRKDMHHKVARKLVDRYGVIAVESLNIRGMLKNHRLARSISDAGWGSFILTLTSKAESAGCRVIVVSAKNTSQECSGCGVLVEKTLSVRVHRCGCGLVLDRDVNAARNILGRAVPGFVKQGVAHA